MATEIFDQEIKKLNDKQKEAVESIDGPVMVVAGPGTGKTQILSLRIGNILKKTDTPAEGILCLTFTNSGVEAMKNRRERYIGKRGQEVHVSTFHSFAVILIEKYYDFLDFEVPPTLMGDDEAIFLIDDILNNYEWEHLSPLSNKSLYFNELKSLVSLLKRERIGAKEFLSFTEAEIEDLKNDPESISSRGPTKGEMKKNIEKRIESLEKTKEFVRFYETYEEEKRKLSMMDYDDILEYAVYLVENFEDVKNEIRENYLYVLVDEHQDSSGVQNSFLKAVWQDTENPNIFVVGDDRQLIYGFSGANSSYFEEFAHIFGKTKLIFLVENYRSTAPILLAADDLLSSTLSSEKLKSNQKGDDKISISEYSYPRDEIIGAGIYFKQKIEEGLNPNECALLVSKNYQVKTAVNILSDMGLPVQDGGNSSLFAEYDADGMRQVLRFIANPLDHITLSKTLLNKSSGISLIKAHQFLKDYKHEEITISKLIENNQAKQDLFEKNDEIFKWGKKLEDWINRFQDEKLSNIVNTLGNELLINESTNNREMLKRVEIVRSFIHLAIMFEQKQKEPTLDKFIEYLDRLDSYNSPIELASFGQTEGVRVMTLHKSKGLEYEAVWIAHANEEVLLSNKSSKLSLPVKLEEHREKKSIEEVKKELYVAITRAKRFCNISYARENYTGKDMELVSVIRELPESHFNKKTSEETEKDLLSIDPLVYTKINKTEFKGETIEEVKKLVKENYSSLKVSVSMLNNFFECPWEWYFRSFLRLPEPKQSYLALGTITHGAIEYILKQEILPSIEEVKNKIELDFIKENINNKIDRDRLIKKATEAVKTWIDNYYKDIYDNYKSEYPISLKDGDFPDLLMYGKIDLLETDKDGHIRLTDFKTGSSKTKNEIEKIDDEGRLSKHMRQLAMYSYLLRGDKKDIMIDKSRLLFLEDETKNSLYEVQVDQEKIDLLRRDIGDYEEFLKTGEFVNRKCQVKVYGGEECEYCKLAKKILLK